MDTVTELFDSPWIYAALSVVVSLVSIICAYFYTRRKHAQLQVKVSKKAQSQVKEEVIADIKGSNSWPTENPEKVAPVDTSDGMDPIEFCGHIPSEVKKTQQRIAMKKLEQDMTNEQKAREREVQRKQLEDIFKLMETNNEKFGIKSMDDIQNQMTLYAQ